MVNIPLYRYVSLSAALVECLPFSIWIPGTVGIRFGGSPRFMFPQMDLFPLATGGSILCAGGIP